ncbi:fibrous sheath CABYR-binding protein isoform X2 [Orussus abietinus]|nr:fibrous sheath CABYR-binding protein isoform X2 [Orussus abietinus]
MPKHSSRPMSASTSEKEEKKLGSSVKSSKGQASKMRPESEEPEVQLKVSIQTEDKVEGCSTSKANETEEPTATKDEVKNTAEEAPPQEEAAPEEVNGREDSVEDTPEPLENAPKIKEPKEKTKETEDAEECEIKLSLETDDSQSKPEAEPAEEVSNESEKVTEKVEDQVEESAAVREKEELQNDLPTDTESCSPDVTELAPPEVCETIEPVTTSEATKEKEKTANEASFVCYDSSIMLKDVQIKLNDCLKDNSKLYDTSATENSLAERHREESFGRALRNISGRHSLSRMRHVTLRDYRLSPNNSLYVNTSSASIAPDELTDYKVLHHRTGLTNTLSCNGSPMDRKRKLDSTSEESAKKAKTGSENFLNSSIGLLKGLRRPIQESTPNREAYTFRSSKSKFDGIDSDADHILVDQEVKNSWCSIM